MRVPYVGILLMLLTLVLPASAQINYTVLNPPGATYTVATGISGNNVVGLYGDTNSESHWFLYNIVTQTYTSLDPPVPEGDTLEPPIGISGNYVPGQYHDEILNYSNFWYDIASQTYTTFNSPGPIPSIVGISGTIILGYNYDVDYYLYGFLFNIAGQTYTTFGPPPEALPFNGYSSFVSSPVITGISGNNVVGTYYDENTNEYGYVYNFVTQTYTTLNPPGEDPINQLYPPIVITGISGNYVLGYYYDITNNFSCFVYNITDQTYTILNLPGALPDLGFISGNNIVAGFNDANGQYCFIYNIATEAYFTLNPLGAVPGDPNTDATGACGNSIVGNYFDQEDGTYYGFLATLAVAPQPNLYISQSGNTVTIYWRDVPGWVLQQNNSLTVTTGWTQNDSWTTSNGTNYLNLVSPQGNQFFRLEYP